MATIVVTREVSADRPVATIARTGSADHDALQNRVEPRRDRVTEQHQHQRRPLDSPGVLGRVFPFAVAAVLGVATLIVPSAQHDGALVMLALGLTAAVIVACLILPWRRLPAICQAGPPFVYFAVVIILRQSEGGAASGLSPLLMIPYFWISLYGSRKQLALATVTAAAVLILPILFIGLPQYPVTEWRRAIIWLSIVPVVGYAIRELVERVERLARTDSLTGALNRRAWDDELDRSIARARRLNEPLTLALLDLDHFKAYNDTRGHLAGDELLRATVGAWQTTVRGTDLIARYGGEEFAILMPATDINAADITITRLLSCVPELQTVSAGIAEWHGNETASNFMRRVDTAMYRAKHNGRNQTIHASHTD
jgi:diguanylate cyclase (GGDEF)-like protein